MYFGYMMEENTQSDVNNATEVTSFLKLPVYTREGNYVGHIRNVFLNMEEKRVNSLLITDTNPSKVEGSLDVAVPYRWVNAVGDIVILSHFPERVTTKEEEQKAEEPEEESEIDMVK